ncbi:redoxin [Mucilaginibacter sp. PPCGB 2223]|uniref:TlpA family protein disulfide reductase n=1 Tax=Mucilaginibacter sp. PPCGB 2223 TaxID=1886027 RepID=UPI000824C974|nr:TlpA family protein disulfide reductase [Mucilaginibacter sp. PPCGB 2223]OCX53510.1 redoxin [Mucilaginibacter sp. PPCGB 2223]
MKYRNFILLFLLSTIGLAAPAQTRTVTPITYQQLEKRISNKDTVYIVNFWATWCAPCVAELPNFEKLQQTYKGQPVKVLLLSMDFKSKLNEVKTFASKRKLISEVYLADKPSEQVFIDQVDKNWSGALPGTMIVNAQKGIRKFYEKEFTYDELNKLYQTNK